MRDMVLVHFMLGRWPAPREGQLPWNKRGAGRDRVCVFKTRPELWAVPSGTYLL